MYTRTVSNAYFYLLIYIDTRGLYGCTYMYMRGVVRYTHLYIFACIYTAPEVVRPRPPQATSIPAMIKLMQDEWDSVMLETYTLKKALNTVCVLYIIIHVILLLLP